MRDIKLYYDEEFDFDCDSAMNPVYVDTEDQTLDQRAAVAVCIVQGTIPGAESTGVDWSKKYSASDETQGVMSIYSDAQQMIQMCAPASEDNPSQQYTALLVKDEDTQEITIKTVRGGNTQ